MKVLVILLVLFGTLTTLGVSESFADCNNPHCYAEWVNSGGISAKGIKTDMKVSDLYVFPDNSCVDERVVESIWMDLPFNFSVNELQWIEVGVTTGGFIEDTGTDARCIINKQAYVASSNTHRLNGAVYQEFTLGRQLDSGDNVQLEILESHSDSNSVYYQPRLTDAGNTFYGESPGWFGGEYPTNFRVGIEGTVEPKKQYSPIPQVKFTNTQVNLGTGYNDFVTPGSLFATVNTNDGYQRKVCSDNSLIAGTVTSLDCNLLIGQNQRPTIQNSVEVINVESFRPHINYMTLEATDTDNEYVFFSIDPNSSHQGTVQSNIQPQGHLRNETPTTAKFRFVPVTGVTNDIVTFTVSDGRVGHDREIQYHFIQGTQGLPDAIDDLSASLSGNMVTLNWSHPNSDTAFKDVQIDFNVNGGAWRETCQATRSSETTCTTTVGNGLYEYRVKIKNTVGWSEYSNVVQLYSPDTTPPSIYGVSPVNNQVFTTDIITVSGGSFNVDSGVSRVTISLDGNTPIQASGTINWTWSFTGLAEGSHTVSIVSYNGDGYFTTHPLITFTINTSTIPDVPTSLIANDISSSQIDLIWIGPVNNGGSLVTGYQIERNLNGAGFSTLVIDTGLSSTNFSDLTLSGGNTAEYKVSAINAIGIGSPSNVASATTSSANITPTVNDLNETTDEDIAFTITLSGSDVDGDALSFATVTLPSSGTLSVITGINDTSASITYAPNSNFFGTDSFQYIANDGTINSSNNATISITINPINDSPVASDDSATTNEDTPVVISVLDNDTDVDGDTLIVTDETIDDSATPMSFDDSSNIWWSIPSSFTTMFAQYTTVIKNTIENTLLVLVPSISAILHDSIPSVTVEKMESMEYYSSNYTKFEKNQNEINQARAEIKQLKSDLKNIENNIKEHKKQFTNSQKDLKNAQKQFETRGITNDELIQAQIVYNDANDALNDTQDKLDKITTEFKTAKASLKISKQIKKLIAGDTDLEKIDDRFEKIFKNTRSDGTLIADPKIPVYLRVTNQSTLDLSNYEITAQSDGIIVLKLTPTQIDELSLNDNVGEMRLPDLSESFSHDTTQGVSLTFANDLHSQNITGNGITVGIIDDSFITSDTEIASNIKDAILFDSGGFCGDVSCGKTFGNSHGTAVAEIVVDMAPDVNLVLYTIANTVDFVNAVDNIITRGDVDIITISLGFPTVGGDGTTGFFRDGTSIVAKAVNRAHDAGILVTTAAGNDAKRHWMGTYTPSTISPVLLNLTEYQSVMEFRPSETGIQKACLPVSHAGWTVASWNAWDITTSDYDLFLFDGNMDGVISYSAIDQQTIPSSPIETIFDGTGFSGCLVVSSMNSTQNHLFHITTVGGSITSDHISAGSINTPADASGTFSVGAINFATNTLESFSSHGPTDDGRLAPEICGPDGILSHQASFDPFFGTSSSAPHVAGSAALIKQMQPNISAFGLKQTMIGNAVYDGLYSVDNLCGRDSGLLSVQSISIIEDPGDENESPGGDGGNETPQLLSISSVTDPAHGTATKNLNTTITYLPDANFFGEDTFSYTVSDGNGGTDVGTVTVTVNSINDIPVISLLGNDSVTVEQNSVYSDAGATASDVEDGIITGIVTVNPVNTSVLGVYTITYDVTDSFGTFAVQVTRTVTVSDTIPPVITLNPPNPQIIELGDGYTELGATANDGLSVTIDSTAFVDAVGTYFIFYDSTDVAGNAAITVSRTVSVSNSTAVSQDKIIWNYIKFTGGLNSNVESFPNNGLTVTGSANLSLSPFGGGYGIAGGSYDNLIDGGESISFAFDTPVGVVKSSNNYRGGEGSNAHTLTAYDENVLEIANVTLSRVTGKDMVKELGVQQASTITMQLNDNAREDITSMWYRNYVTIPNYNTIEDGLVGKWSFDGGTITNLAGINTTSSIENGASFADNGLMGKSLSFDGVDDIAQISYDPSYDMGTGSFTLSSWFSINNNTSSHQWMILHGTLDDSFEPAANSGSFTGWGLRYDNYNGLMGVYGDGTTYGHGSCNVWWSCYDALDGSMHHIALVVDKYEPAEYLWYDGDLVSWSPWSFSIGDVDNTQNLEIGGTLQTGIPANSFAGYIDQIRVYDRPLSYADLSILSSENDATTFSSLGVSPDGNNDDYSGMISFDGDNFTLDIVTLRNMQLTALSNNESSTGQYRVGNLSIAESSGMVVAGAPKHDGTNSLLNTGSAFVFDGITGNGLYSFENPNPNPADGFGAAVATSSDGMLYVIAAPGYDNIENFASDAGVVYVYDGAGNILHTIHNPTPQSGDMFDMSLNIADGKIIVDCPSCDGIGNGVVYTFEISELGTDVTSEDDNLPVITILGDNPQTILVNSQYTELGAKIADNDPNYSGEWFADTSILDVTVIGQYTITYTATPDNAGNTAEPVSRTINVISSENFNLLNNSYSLSSWDVITNGGNGWLDYSSGQTNWVGTNQTFATSYKWNEKSITIPFNGIDGTLTITEDYSKTYCGDFTDNTHKNQIPYDQYYLTIELFDINNNLLTDNSTGIIQIIEPCDWSRNWHTAELTISEIPQSTSSIIVTHGGISGEYWAGWYGPVMRNIELVHTG